MTWGLRDGVSYCLVSGRAVFLDLTNDRYFCLHAEAERAFLAIAAGETAESENLLRLSRQGVLTPDGARRAEPCPRPLEPRSSLLDEPPRSFDPWHVAMAFRQLGATRRVLRRHGLAATLDKLRGRRRPVGPDTARLAAKRVADAFSWTGIASTTTDRCLIRSIAVMQRTLQTGGGADLILGVKLEPFRAHCWVQDGEALINDRPDVVRDFTPILVV